MRVFFKGRDQLVIREPKTVIGRVIELDKSLEESFINIRLDDTEQVSKVSVKRFEQATFLLSFLKLKRSNFMKLYCLVYLVGRAMPYDVYNKTLYKSFDI